ncbi:glycosyltransferase [Paludibacterium sp. THUN1379]|uniref:MraY family glycosyltransferase n=1 Tax=Paludibacterium sp. THUN1379 TaxID=3112107 RepID=UPI0030930CD5|nr:glycosyltransferase [Paludibacterium sp. THUN1379]
MLLILLMSMLCAFISAVLLIRYQHLHAQFSADNDLQGVQKFHATPVPRIGGVPIFLGLLVGSGLMFWLQRDLLGIEILLVALPAYVAGLVEDITKGVGVKTRLGATLAAALLGILVFHAVIGRLGLPLVDGLLLKFPIVAILFTMIAVGGVAHSINIIDGYNGLSGMVSMLIFIALGYVSFKVGDSLLLSISASACGALLGFLLLNYPRGLIFAGDGGAYLVGFLIAEVSVLLVARNAQVSPWFPLLCVVYPVFETLYSIYRKKVLRGMSPGVPDGLHLHMLVYKRLVLWMVGSREAEHLTRRNSMTAPYLWGLTALSIAPAMLFWQSTPVLMVCVLLFVLLYLALYRMIIRFKTPRWLVRASCKRDGDA